MMSKGDRYEAIIGLEIHAELATQSKMFCGCRVVDSVTAPPNTAVCPVCLGMPGMLPVVNRAAVVMAMRVALALHCTIEPRNIFARKNYFYPDLPKSYQISQYEAPLAVDGWVDIDVDGLTRRVHVRRVHLEEDTGKLTHGEKNGSAYSLVDYNRSGVPLLEIVSEPDMRTVEEARAYAVKVRHILRYLGVNSGDMEKGVIRFEANVSVRPSGNKELGTRTEVKNLNSFRSLASAAAFEIERQTAVLEAGGVVKQATLGWDEASEKTYSQRSKEDAQDYRYFPEPDLPPLAVDESWVAEVRQTLPVLPDARRERYVTAFNLSAYDAGLLVEERAVADWYETAVGAGGDPKKVANWIVNDLFRLLNERRTTIEALPTKPGDLVDLISLVDDRVINHSTAREVLAAMVESGEKPEAIVDARGWRQIGDEAALAAVIDQVLADNPDEVADYRAGKVALRGWFVGQVMRATGGQADPTIVNRLLIERLAA